MSFALFMREEGLEEGEGRGEGREEKGDRRKG